MCYLLVLAKRPQELGLDVAEEDGTDWNCTQTTKGKRRRGLVGGGGGLLMVVFIGCDCVSIYRSDTMRDLGKK